MGAKAGRKGGKSYNIRTVGKGWWRKYLDKMRRKTAKEAAIEEQLEAGICGWESGEYWCYCGNPTTCDNGENLDE